MNQDTPPQEQKVWFTLRHQDGSVIASDLPSDPAQRAVIMEHAVEVRLDIPFDITPEDRDQLISEGWARLESAGWVRNGQIDTTDQPQNTPS